MGGAPAGTPRRRRALPRLDDVLDAWPDVRINVDLKSRGAVRPFVELIRSRGALDRVCVASFSDRRRRTPSAGLAGNGRVASSLGLRGSLAAVALASGGAPSACSAPPCRGPSPYRCRTPAGARRIVTRRLVGAVHAAGAQVHVWTVDDPAVCESSSASASTHRHQSRRPRPGRAGGSADSGGPAAVTGSTGEVLRSRRPAPRTAQLVLLRLGELRVRDHDADRAVRPYLTSVAKQAACPGSSSDAVCRMNLSVLGIPVNPGSLALYAIR